MFNHSSLAICRRRGSSLLVQPTKGLFIPPKFLNFQFFLDYLIHSRINSKFYQYVLTLSALDPRVYILAYDFDLYSVLVLLNASLTSV